MEPLVFAGVYGFMFYSALLEYIWLDGTGFQGAIVQAGTGDA